MYKTRAISLYSYNLAEADKIMVIYSREQGIVRCVAKDIKNPDSKYSNLSPALLSLSEFRCTIKNGKNLDLLVNADIKNGFKEIKNNIFNYSCAMHGVELIKIFGLENDPNSKIVYDSFYDFLKKISNLKDEEQNLLELLKFQFLMSEITGYRIGLDSCSICSNKTNNVYFSNNSGGLICHSCKTTNASDAQKLKAESLDILNGLAAQTEELFSKKSLIYTFKVLKNYLSYHSSKDFKSANMLESLCC